LSTAIIPFNLIFQVVLLPVYLLLFADTTGTTQLLFLLDSMLTDLFSPFILAILTNILFQNRQHLKQVLISKLSPLTIIFLAFAIIAMFASQGSLLLQHLDVLWFMTIPILLFLTINLFLSQKIGQLIRFPQ